MVVEQVIEIIQGTGFPIFVAVYVLFRLEPAISKLDKTIRLLTIVVASQTGNDVEEIERKFFEGRRDGC